MAKRDGYELVEQWQKENKAYHFEGDHGLDKLSKLCQAIGYGGHGFKYGDPIESFLSDNPGACEKIVEFITEWLDRSPEWRESMESELEAEDEGCEPCGERAARGEERPADECECECHEEA